MRETKTLKQLYYEHIQAEETLIFALATQVLDREALAQIGLEFQLRRK